MRRTSLPKWLALAMALGPAAWSQDAPPGTLTEIVRLDVVVTDAAGAPVRGLGPSDFQVLEDGKPQTISNFEPPGEEQAAETSETPGGGSRAERTESIAVLVDDLHLARESMERVKETLRAFVDALDPQIRVALVAVSAPEALVPFTSDRAVLRQAIGHLASHEGTVASDRGVRLSAAQAELILRGDRSALSLATHSVMEDPGSTLDANSARARMEAVDGYTPAGVDPAEKAAAREVQRQARMVLVDALRYSQVTLGAIADVLTSLAPLPGRKVCLIVSDGFLVGTGTSEEQTRMMREVTDAATRSGAALYALQGHGVSAGAADAALEGPAAPPGLRERVTHLVEQEHRDTLLRLSDDTGGLLVQGSDPEAGLKRMLAENKAYYALAYEPTNRKRDGRFRKIEVRLAEHRDLVVRTRKGYLAPGGGKREARRASVPVGLTAPHALDEAEARGALAAAPPTSKLDVGLAADYLDLPPAGPQAIVQARVELAGLPWQVAAGRRMCTVELVGGVYDPDGHPVGTAFGRRFDLDFGPAEYERALPRGLRYRQQVALPPGQYQLRLIAREPAGPPLGAARAELRVPDLAQGDLTLSSVFVSASAAEAEAGAGGAEDAIESAQVRRRFSRKDTLYFQLYVYNARRDEKGNRDVVLQAQIRTGGELVAASKPQAVVFLEKDGVPLPQSNGMPLDSLAPGRYELRIVVVDRKANATANGVVDFAVE